MSVRERRGEAPRPKAPSPPLSPNGPAKPGSSPEFWREVVNKYRAGVDVLPENVFTAIAAILNAAGHEQLGTITIQITALDKPHLGLYGRWLVRWL